ncbi:Ig-like domain-containing protein, partial [Photobacterium proteolyticum]|uniref:Ig-like domain-containing protein n=1 Tax=Photobacterium proteolyticum TaxID=1903952 RepID=UPI000AEF28D5
MLPRYLTIAVALMVQGVCAQQYSEASYSEQPESTSVIEQNTKQSQSSTYRSESQAMAHSNTPTVQSFTAVGKAAQEANTLKPHQEKIDELLRTFEQSRKSSQRLAHRLGLSGDTNTGFEYFKLPASAQQISIPTDGIELVAVCYYGRCMGGPHAGEVCQTDAFCEVGDNIAPSITAVAIQDVSHKVGDTATATITVDSDSDDYTSGSGGVSGTIAGYTVSTLTKVSDTTYTVSFTITDGGTNIAAASTIPVNISLTDSSGNTSSAYTTAISQNNDAIYANLPDISLSADTDTIAEDGGSATLTATISGSLNNQWPSDITVNLAYSGTATATTDYSKSDSITISAGNTTGTTTVTGVADTLYDAASAETVIVDVSSVSVGTEDGTQQQTISITDAEAAPTVSLSVGTNTVAENGGTASIMVTLDHATYEDVTVGLSYSGTATSGTDFATPSSNITISNGTTSANAATGITSSDDGDEEGAETIIIDVSSVAGGGVSEHGAQRQTITISDDDDTTQPVIISVSVPVDNTYVTGQSLSFTVNTDEIVTVSGSPSLTLNIGGTTKLAAYASGSGSQALVFTYSVETGLVDNDGISVTALSMNADEIQDAAGNDLNVALNSVGSLTNVRVDSVSPTVTGVSASTADGQYNEGDNIALNVSFDEAVTVTGTPRLLLETGTTGRYATYTSGSGSTALVFQYSIQAGDTSSDLDYASTTALELNSGTINDSNGNAADLTLASPGSANSLGANKAIVIDTTQPTVTISSNKSALKRGETATISFTLSESSSDFIKDDVTVVGGTLSALSGSGTSYTATFTPSEDNNVTATIDVVAGKFTDSAGNNNAAATQETISVDTAVPTVAISDNTTGTATGDVTYTFTFSEDVTGFTADDIT